MQGTNKKRSLPREGATISNKPPSWLVNPHAKTIWKATVDELAASSRAIPQAYVETFSGYCSCAATVRETDAILAKEGLTVDGGREGVKRHPAIVIRAGALLQLRNFAESLGLTPASSGRLPKTVEDQESPWAKFMRKNP